MARSLTGSGTVHGTEQQMRHAATSPGATLLARLGYLAIGAVYIIIGALAARIAFNSGSVSSSGGKANVDRTSALEAIYREPFGKFALLVVAVGLLGYVLFCLSRAIFDTEGVGTKPGGLLKRAGNAVAAVSYGALGIGAARLALGTGSAGKSSDTSTRDWTQQLLNEPYGVTLVVALGAIIAGYAIYQFVRAATATFAKRLELSRTGPRVKDAVILSGRIGYAARGIVFAEIGIFLIIAARRHDTQEARGIGGALSQLADEPYGHLLLGLVALGLIAYGIFNLAEARYRRIGRS